MDHRDRIVDPIREQRVIASLVAARTGVDDDMQLHTAYAYLASTLHCIQLLAEGARVATDEHQNGKWVSLKDVFWIASEDQAANVPDDTLGLKLVLAAAIEGIMEYEAATGRLVGKALTNSSPTK